MCQLLVKQCHLRFEYLDPLDRSRKGRGAGLDHRSRSERETRGPDEELEELEELHLAGSWICWAARRKDNTSPSFRVYRVRKESPTRVLSIHPRKVPSGFQEQTTRCGIGCVIPAALQCPGRTEGLARLLPG